MAKVVALENLPEVKLLENITRETAQRVIQELSAYKGQKVALSIFSVGGDVLASKAIGSYIGNEANGLTVEARVYGNAFSGALIICAHCQAAYIAAGSFALGHEAYASDDEGNKIPADKLSDELRSTLEAMNADQVDLFAKRTKKKKDTIERWMKEDRHMSAEDATEFGLFDGIIPQAARLAAWHNTKSTPMAEDKKTVTFKVERAELAKAVISGEVHVPADQVAAAEKATIEARDARIAALEKELTDLKAAKEAEAAKVTAAEASATEATKAKEVADLEVVAAKAEVVKLTAKVEELTKTPLKAQVLPDGTQVVTPGGDAEKPKVELSARAQYAADAQNALSEAKARIYGKPVQA